MRRKNSGTQDSGMFEEEYENLKKEIDMLVAQIRMLQQSISNYERRISSLEVKALSSFVENRNRASIGYLFPSIGDTTTK